MFNQMQHSQTIVIYLTIITIDTDLNIHICIATIVWLNM